MNQGVHADSIIFANPTKPTVHLRYAAEQNVRKMTVDGEFELHKIHDLFPSAEYVHFDFPITRWLPLQASNSCVFWPHSTAWLMFVDSCYS